jgi:hypothetical protein
MVIPDTTLLNEVDETSVGAKNEACAPDGPEARESWSR